MRIGVMLPNWVGDLAMATPFLRTLRETHPAAEVIGVCRKHLAPLLEGTPWIDRFHLWENCAWNFLTDAGPLIWALRREQLDTMFVLRNSGLAAGMAYFGGAKQIIGYDRRGSGWFLTRKLPPLRQDGKLLPVSGVDYYLRLAEEFGCRPRSRQLELATFPADEQAADEQWRKLDLPSGRELILLNTGGGYGESKHWPIEESVALCQQLARGWGLSVLVLCGPAERARAARIAHLANHPRVKSVAKEDVSFGVTKAILRRARMLVTTDSGLRHVATAMRTPTVVLFGPIDPRWSRNHQDLSIELQLPLACAPCGKRICPLQHGRCMRDLKAQLVLSAVQDMLLRTANDSELPAVPGSAPLLAAASFSAVPQPSAA